MSGFETRRTMIMTGALAIAIVSSACGGRMPDDLGPRGATLAGCPDSPNCVSSASPKTDEEHSIDAFEVVGPVANAFAVAREVIAETPRASIEKEGDGYLHAVYTSRLIRYRDDLELRIDGTNDRIEVRSASRVGYGDMGVNRARVEALRAALAARSVVRAAGD